MNVFVVEAGTCVRNTCAARCGLSPVASSAAGGNTPSARKFSAEAKHKARRRECAAVIGKRWEASDVRESRGLVPISINVSLETCKRTFPGIRWSRWHSPSDRWRAIRKREMRRYGLNCDPHSKRLCSPRRCGCELPDECYRPRAAKIREKISALLSALLVARFALDMNATTDPSEDRLGLL